MPSPSHLIVGLGNPGPDYAATRHNIGFMALDALADHYRCAGWKKKFRGELAATSADPALLMLKPMTFMNLSGEAVGEAMRFHKLTPAQTIVLHDDLDVPAGQLRVKQGGGSGGHNGIKSIDAHIGPDYWRVRLGIGRPADGTDKDSAVTNYVLGAFAKADQSWLQPLLDSVAAEFDSLLDGRQADYVNKVTKRVSAG